MRVTGILVVRSLAVFQELFAPFVAYQRELYRKC
jgi:hypothetical protein